jgi:glycosyltransferase involved in cell wall biosynthesis
MPPPNIAKSSWPPWDNQMTILYHFRTRGAGAEAVHIAGIVNAFEKIGHRVILSSPTGVDPRQTAGASPFANSRSRHLPRILFELLEILYNIPAFWRNLRLARHNDCRLIYERHAFFLFSTALVAVIRRCPLVIEVNELVGDPRVRAQPSFSALARWTDRFLFRRASLIVVVSPHLQRRVREYGIPAGRILVLPNAVSDEELAPPAPLAAPLVPNRPPNTFLLAFTGWLVEWHRLDFLIQALAAPQFSSVILVIIGEGPLRTALEDQARAAGVRLHFTGPLPHSTIPAALRAADACIVPHSNDYRSPIKLFEYMAQKRPILAPRTEPIQAVIEDGKHALLFTPLDIESLRSVLSKLLTDSNLRQYLGKNARQLIEERHTWRQNATRVLGSIDKNFI